ncbi:metallophosphoesterase family protein [Roseococcus sp. YIM B11640]|uniref:metallophosphoesterase family protein n=1 Tax=Roseococcus sp. YIM B11640 TaxID=3133973 RepID=UPI003C7E631E
MSFRIAQITDTHLSPARPLFDGNFAPLAEALRDARPELVIHTGDLSLNGADSDEDLRHGAAMMRSLGLDWVAVPGNHDVGDDLTLPSKQPVSVERFARWENCVSPLGFFRDVPGWRIIGLDTQGFAANEGHRERIAAAIRGAGPRRIALFQHKPITEEALADTAVNYWPLLPAPRAELLAMFGGRRPDVIASGHVHQWRDREADGIRQIWAPAVAFIVGDAFHVPVGHKLLGWIEHEFHEDGRHEAHLHAMENLTPYDLGEIPEAYGPLTRAA